jgi:glycosidase
MTDLLIHDPSRLRDTMATWYFQALSNDLSVPLQEAADRAARMTRDKNRTPMQWRNAPNAGFSPGDVVPWLPVNPNFMSGVNVQEQENDPASLLNFYRRLLRIRKQTPALMGGSFSLVHPRARDYFAFLRKMEEQTVLVILNYSANPLNLNLQTCGVKNAHTLFSSAGRGRAEEKPSDLHIGPYEIFIGIVNA